MTDVKKALRRLLSSAALTAKRPRPSAARLPARQSPSGAHGQRDRALLPEQAAWRRDFRPRPGAAAASRGSALEIMLTSLILRAQKSPENGQMWIGLAHAHLLRLASGWKEWRGEARAEGFMEWALNLESVRAALSERAPAAPEAWRPVQEMLGYLPGGADASGQSKARAQYNHIALMWTLREQGESALDLARWRERLCEKWAWAAKGLGAEPAWPETEREALRALSAAEAAELEAALGPGAADLAGRGARL